MSPRSSLFWTVLGFGGNGEGNRPIRSSSFTQLEWVRALSHLVGQAAAEPGALRSKWAVARVACGLVELYIKDVAMVRSGASAARRF